MCGRGAHAPLPASLVDDPLRRETAPSALWFLLTARLVDCLPWWVTLRATVIGALAAVARTEVWVSERHPRERHTQRQHERREQQRDALAHQRSSLLLVSHPIASPM
jgi:hypothetical protein